MRGTDERCLSLNARYNIVRTLASGTIRAVRDGYETVREWREAFARLPQRGLHFGIRRREEFERHFDRSVPVQRMRCILRGCQLRIYRFHARLTCSLLAAGAATADRTRSSSSWIALNRSQRKLWSPSMRRRRASGCSTVFSLAFSLGPSRDSYRSNSHIRPLG